VTQLRRGADVLACFGQLAATTAHMVQLARSRRWESLPRLDAVCAELVDALRDVPPVDLTSAERARIVAAARRIREDQAELRSLVQPQGLALLRRMDGARGLPAQ
jgi:flagellar protein FliT